MADPFEDRIDFGKLERELEAAVKADAKYWRENDAKLRAVEQRVESYEQFRDIVAASHLRPLEKKDKISESKLEQSWNRLASNQLNSAIAQESDGMKLSSLETLPKNSLEFNRDWKRLGKMAPDKYSFLLQLGHLHLAKILKAEIGLGLLGEFIVVLDACYSQERCLEIYRILEVLPKCGRFTLALGFLSQNEKDSCSSLLNKIEDATTQDSTKEEELSKTAGTDRSCDEQTTIDSQSNECDQSAVDASTALIEISDTEVQELKIKYGMKR